MTRPENRLLPPMAKDEQPRDDQSGWGGARFVAVYDSGVRCSYVEADGTSCKRQADTRGMCKMHYRRMRRRERGLKPPGLFRDLTGGWYGPRADLYVDHYIPDQRVRKLSVWWVIHDIARGGCGAQGPVDTGSLRRGDCPGHCHRDAQRAKFKMQTQRKAEGATGRLMPLTERGRAGIAAANTRDRLAGKRGINTLPRTKDGRVLKRSAKPRGGGTGAGRRLKPGITGVSNEVRQRLLAAARAKAYRDRKRASRVTVSP